MSFLDLYVPSITIQFEFKNVFLDKFLNETTMGSKQQLKIFMWLLTNKFRIGPQLTQEIEAAAYANNLPATISFF